MTLFDQLPQPPAVSSILNKILSAKPSTEATEKQEEQKKNCIASFRSLVAYTRRVELSNNRIDILRLERFCTREFLTNATEVYNIIHHANTYQKLFSALSLFENVELLDSELHTLERLDFTTKYILKGNKVNYVKFHKNGKITLYFVTPQAAQEFYNLFDFSTLPTSRW